MSAITDFFTKDGTDHKCRTLLDMIDMTDGQIEASHDLIQWMFPLHEKSYHSLTAPVMTAEDVEALSHSTAARSHLLDAFFRFEDFLGVDSLSGEFDPKKTAWWCHQGNHNLLRITRVIRCLRLFGLDTSAQFFYETVVKVANNYANMEKTLGYWKRAMEDPVFDSMTQNFLQDRRIDL
jgi:hypothetical protein